MSEQFEKQALELKDLFVSEHDQDDEKSALVIMTQKSVDDDTGFIVNQKTYGNPNSIMNLHVSSLVSALEESLEHLYVEDPADLAAHILATLTVRVGEVVRSHRSKCK